MGMTLLMCFVDPLEYWIETDEDIDTDICGSTLSPQDFPLDTSNTVDHEYTIIVRWIVLLISLFQSKFSIMAFKVFVHSIKVFGKIF